jgi:hypothetical protein
MFIIQIQIFIRYFANKVSNKKMREKNKIDKIDFIFEFKFLLDTL